MTWAAITSEAALRFFKEREMFYGVKVLLSTTQDSDGDVFEWLNCVCKQPASHGDKISEEYSVCESVFKAVNESPEITTPRGIVNNWIDLKKRVQEVMLKNTKIPKTLIISECGIKDNEWESIVKSDAVFTKFAPISLPYYAAILKRNIKVYKYPEKEVVRFFCFSTSANVETIELCLHRGRFFPVTPFLDAGKPDVAEGLHDKIKKQEKQINDLEIKLKNEIKEAEESMEVANKNQCHIAEETARQMMQEFRDGKQKTDNTERLNDQIRELAQKSKTLESQLISERKKAAIDNEKIEKLTKDLEETKELLSLNKKHLEEAISDQDRIAKETALRVVNQFRDTKHRQIQENYDENEDVMLLERMLLKMRVTCTNEHEKEEIGNLIRALQRALLKMAKYQHQEPQTCGE